MKEDPEGLPSIQTDGLDMERLPSIRTEDLHSMLSPESINDALLDLNLGTLWQWILCFCIVNFDLEDGQSLECIYPPVDLTDSEKRTVCFSAFPDSNSVQHVGDSIFSFRMRNSKFTEYLYINQTHMPSQNTALDFQQSGGLPVDTDGYTYGFVFFRQEKDDEVPRGYFQKSLVLLSPHPWPGLFCHLVSVLGPDIMSALVRDRRAKVNSESSHSADALLEAACGNIASWPSPPSRLCSPTYLATKFSLPFLGSVEHFSFPPSRYFAQLFDESDHRKRQNSSTLSASLTIRHVLCNPGNFYQIFRNSLESLWTAWELMTLAEPILVIGDSPRACSNLTWALVELIKPVFFV